MNVEDTIKSLENILLHRCNQFTERESNEIMTRLQNIANTEDDAIGSPVSDLYSFCQKIPLLQELIREDEPVFRGKPIPQSTVTNPGDLRLRVNRLIDAFDRDVPSENESTNDPKR